MTSTEPWPSRHRRQLSSSPSPTYCDEAAPGAQEGRKNRPYAIVLTTLDDGGHSVVYVATIIHTPPEGDITAVALPLG